MGTWIGGRRLKGVSAGTRKREEEGPLGTEERPRLVKGAGGAGRRGPGRSWADSAEATGAGQFQCHTPVTISVTAHVHASLHTMSDAPALSYNVRWVTRTFSSRAKVERLLGPEHSAGSISSHDYDAALSFFPGFHNYYGVRILLPVHRALTHSPWPR